MADIYLQVLVLFFSFIFVVINLIIGTKIVLKYFEHKVIELFFVGVAWMFMASPWLPETISLFMIIFNLSAKEEFILYVNVIINLAILPIPVLFWLTALTNLLNIKNHSRRTILIVFTILSIIFEIYLFYSLFTNPSSLGTVSGVFSVKWSLYFEIILLSCVAIVLVTGLLFVRESLKSSNPEIKLKGKNLLIAFLLFTIGALIDATLTIPITNLIARLILVVSSIEFYIGFILPDWAKKKFLKGIK